MPKFGFSDDAWEAAKQQARDILIDFARREDTIAYSDLATRIHAITLDPHSYAMRAFLGEISTAEHHQGRGMLSAVVVYKYGEQMPGPGFFDLARSLGYRIKDETEFWVEAVRTVYGAWSQKTP